MYYNFTKVCSGVESQELQAERKRIALPTSRIRSLLKQGGLDGIMSSTFAVCSPPCKTVIVGTTVEFLVHSIEMVKPLKVEGKDSLPL